MDYVKQIASDPAPNIIAAMARMTGKMDVVRERIDSSSGNVVVVSMDGMELAKLALFIREQGAVVLSSSPAQHQFKIAKRKIHLMTWSLFEAELKKTDGFLKKMQIADLIVLEPWNADKQVERLLHSGPVPKRMLLIGTPNSTGTYVSRLYHSGTWKTYKIPYMESPRYDPQIAGQLIAELGAEAALGEVLAEVPKL